MSTDKPVYLKEEELQEIQDELEHLTTTRRKEVAQLIAEAKAEGDLRENAGYDEAKTQQGFLEGRIRELEIILKNAEIIDEDGTTTSKVVIGSTVVVEEEDTDFEETYEIVGSIGTDPANGKISNESPMGQALLGKKKGAKVKVKSPSGQIVFKILRIE